MLELCGLTGSRGRRVRTLSGGMRRRLDLGLALVGDPELLFLDEPTTGFDPTARRSAWEMIDGLRRLGKTVLLTSHYMDEVERLADRIAVLRGGRIVATGTPATLGGRDLAVAVISFDLAGVLGPLPAGPWERPQEVAGRVVLRTLQPTRALSVLTTWALAEQTELVGLTVSRPTLEETYLELSGTAAP